MSPTTSTSPPLPSEISFFPCLLSFSWLCLVVQERLFTWFSICFFNYHSYWRHTVISCIWQNKGRGTGYSARSASSACWSACSCDKSCSRLLSCSPSWVNNSVMVSGVRFPAEHISGINSSRNLWSRCRRSVAGIRDLGSYHSHAPRVYGNQINKKPKPTFSMAAPQVGNWESWECCRRNVGKQYCSRPS